MRLHSFLVRADQLFNGFVDSISQLSISPTLLASPGRWPIGQSSETQNYIQVTSKLLERPLYGEPLREISLKPAALETGNVSDCPQCRQCSLRDRPQKIDILSGHAKQWGLASERQRLPTTYRIAASCFFWIPCLFSDENQTFLQYEG